MLATVGDLVDDIVVRLGGRVHVASDTDAVIERRRGGSAANVAAVSARISGRSRFLGQVGDDARGAALVKELAEEGVDVSVVRAIGRTGAIVVLVDQAGERTFLTDPGSARDLDEPEREWLDGIDVLHVPLYSLAHGQIATTSRTLIEWAHCRKVPVSLDLSSVAVIDSLGVDSTRSLVERSSVDVVFANADEAVSLGIDGPVASALTIVKRGGVSVVLHQPGTTAVEIPAHDIGHVGDTTGAGDAFAAGFLTHSAWRTEPAEACKAGHAAAAALLRGRASP